ncbi:MAG TPA: ATP-binding cassette domain-containing protein, partial [Rhodospirillales bacterium]|nr:ATP-binding cassette domain-containing protein [Rhodospirillales bacterium]
MPEPASILPLAVRGLELAFRGRPALAGVSFTLGGEGLTVVLGANGAGKSVLLRVLHGLLPAERGTVRWNGRPPGPAIWRRQAMVFQKPVLLRRSVAANIDFALAARGVPRGERRRRLARVL